MNKMKYSIIILLIVYCCDAYSRGGFGGFIRLGRSLNAVSKASKVYTINTLSIERLKSCIVSEKQLDQMIVQLESEEEIIGNSLVEVEAFGNKVKAEKNRLELQEVVPPKTNKEIESFNSEVDYYNGLVKTYRNMVEKYNSIEIPYDRKVDEYERLRLNYNSICSGKSYYEDDMAEAKKQLSNSGKT